MPEMVITKVQNVPEAAGELVVALILYKVDLKFKIPKMPTLNFRLPSHFTILRH